MRLQYPGLPLALQFVHILSTLCPPRPLNGTKMPMHCISCISPTALFQGQIVCQCITHTADDVRMVRHPPFSKDCMQEANETSQLKLDVSILIAQAPGYCLVKILTGVYHQMHGVRCQGFLAASDATCWSWSDAAFEPKSSTCCIPAS